MLAIGTSSQALHPEALSAPGGFLWWYLDLVSPQGDGVVLIWAFGLPFLPGRESASRRGEGLPGRQQPSLAISVYRQGKPVFYLLQAYDPDDAEVDLVTGRVRLGNSRFRSWEEGGRRIVQGDLDLPVPGSARLTGRFSVEGAALRCPAAVDVRHVWAPLTSATEGTVALHLGQAELVSMTGRAYHDANGSVLPLSELGISEWAWGREAMDGHEDVHYVLWPDNGEPASAYLLRLHETGAVDVERAEVVSSQRSYGWFGMPWHREIVLRSDHRTRVIRPGAVVDDGPFYMRSMLGTGTAEWVRPSRVDLSWMRPFVSMCVHHPHASNAVLLPFFTGERATRWRRLLAAS